MAKESSFVDIALSVAREILAPPLSIERAAALLYKVAVDNELRLTVDPKSPRRGTSAFQTDLCVFETKPSGIVIPRVVFEFKTHISTHDVLIDFGLPFSTIVTRSRTARSRIVARLSAPLRTALRVAGLAFLELRVPWRPAIADRVVARDLLSHGCLPAAPPPARRRCTAAPRSRRSARPGVASDESPGRHSVDRVRCRARCGP